MALLDDGSATQLFNQMKIQPEVLEEMDQKRIEAGEEAKYVDGPAVMDPGQLRSAFAELGDTVEGKSLFALVQLADPDGDGTMPLDLFLEVVKVRREQIEKARQEKQAFDAYVALGGSEDQAKRVASDGLVAITKDFVGDAAAAAALKAVVKHKMKSVQEVLDMGGELDEEEEEELKDTSTLSFEEVKAFAEGLSELGLSMSAPEDDAGGEVLR